MKHYFRNFVIVPTTYFLQVQEIKERFGMEEALQMRRNLLQVDNFGFVFYLLLV